jgi:hypothetical protein
MHLIQGEWDIDLKDFLHGVAGEMDWHEVVDIRGYHEPITEIEEAKLEQSLIEQLEELWERLTFAFEQATEADGLCKRIIEVGFIESRYGSFADKPYFEIELAPAIQSVSQLADKGESARCEFKSTLRVNLHTSKEDKKIEHSCLKTIAAFLNSHGGYLLIGVKDDGTPLGIDVDGFPNEDKMQLHLVNLLKQRIGAEHLVHVESRFEAFDGKRVLIVKCKPSNVPVYLREGNIEQFYVRTGPATTELLPSQIQDYIKQRF